MPHTEQTWRLLTSGWLPGWAGLLLGIGLVWFVLWQLRLEFRRVRPSALTHWVLPGLRLMIVALLVWLLCRPELVWTKRWPEKPRLLLLTDKTRSMDVVEEFAFRHEKLDMLESSGQASFPKRQRAAGTLARLAANLLRDLEPFARACQDDLDRLGTGLPLTPGMNKRIDAAARTADICATQLDAAKAELPTQTGDKLLTADIIKLQQAVDQLAVPLRTVGGDATLVRQNAATHPETLQVYAGKLQNTLAAAKALLPTAHAVQDKLDALFVPEKDLQRTVADRNGSTRSLIARYFASDVERRSDSAFRIGRPEVPVTAAYLRDLCLQQQPAAMVYLTDGTTAWPDRDLRELSLLGGTPVHTVLVGQDGVQPPDAGIIAVETPYVAVRGRPFVLRVLVSCCLPPGKRPELTVSRNAASGSSPVLATAPLPETATGEIVLDVPITIDDSGIVGMKVSLANTQLDALPGNESVSTFVSVWPETPRILLVSGEVNSDTAAWGGVLAALAPDALDVLVFEPGLRELSLGNERGTFPATAADWKRVDLAVFTGPVPKGLPPAALAGLKQAIESGLRVVLQDTVVSAGGASAWANALALGFVTPSDTPREFLSGSLHPPTVPNRLHWVAELYHLGADRTASEERLAALPLATFTPRVGGEPIVNAWAKTTMPSLGIVDGRRVSRGVFTEYVTPWTVVATSTIGEGGVFFCGISHFGSLRAGGNNATVNRLMTGLAACALRLPQPAAKVDVSNYEAAPNERRDFALTPHAANPAAIAKATGGQSFLFTDGAQKIVEALPKPSPVWREDSRLIPLWTGVWPLLLLLVLVSAEYLLRRRAGRVM